MISSTSLPKKWLTSSSRGTQSRKSNNIFKKVMLHVLPEIIDKFIISQNRKEKNKKRKKEHVPYGCAQFFISISEIKVIKNRQRPYNEACRVSRFSSLRRSRYHHGKAYFRKVETLPVCKTKKNKTGNVLLSQAASHQVSSALRSLTSVFEMGTGVASPLLSPDFLFF